jgi:DNA-binding MarR family transcriptional regulator
MLAVRARTGDDVAVTDLRASYLIGRVDRIMRAELERSLSDVGLAVPELTALSVLAARPGLSNARLARRSLVTPQGMHKVVRSLEDRGLVIRTPSAHGGRSLEAYITDAGTEVLSQAERAQRIAERRCLEPLSEVDRSEFERLLRAVARLDVEPGTGTDRTDA